eukprot:TRINITY_DN11234_c0_g1_i1.p1 TRINITY_DN11234_c0_g1~~TRINITY_DN11234_c0_g1_i1.p1  ORF type:complete len:244 (-),score=20.02 TRINITY_DN11234_c0_g1_i1:20-751(-)
MSSRGAIKLHPNWYQRHASLFSAVRGFRNGIISGVRIRLPYVIQAVIYAVLYREESYRNRVKFIVKQAFQHGRNLGLFVCIYKAICHILRKYVGVTGGLESIIAGFVGGFFAFGDSKGLSGSVNNQIVLYLFARGMIGLMASGVKRGYFKKGSALDVKSELGFRVLAGFSLALILYLTEYEPGTLAPSFISTMNFLYYDSDTPNQPFLPSARFMPFLIIVAISLLEVVWPQLTLEPLLGKLIP